MDSNTKQDQDPVITEAQAMAGENSCRKCIAENVKLSTMTRAVSELFSVSEADKNITYRFDVLYRFNLRNVMNAAKHNGVSDAIMYDTVLMIAALQGIVNRNGVHLYIDYIGNGYVDFPGYTMDAYMNPHSPTSDDTDDFWFTYLRKNRNLLSNQEVTEITSIGKVVELFYHFIKGVVVWDSSVPATSNVACTVAGVEDLLPMRYDTDLGVYDYFVRRNPYFSTLCNLFDLFAGTGVIPDTTLKSSGSPKCDAYLWALELYLKTGKTCRTAMCSFIDAYSLSDKSTAYYNVEDLCLINRDYYISNRCFFFDLSMWEEHIPNDDRTQKLGTDYETLCKILEVQNLYADGNLVTVTGFPPWKYKYSGAAIPDGPNPVACEWKFVDTLSTYYMQLDASLLKGYANASVFQHIPLKSSYKQKARATEIKLDMAKNYVCLYMGDWDSSNGVGGAMVSAYWNDPNRGKVPLAWGINTFCEKNAPQALQYIYETQSENDMFVISDNGTGYITLSSLLQPDRPAGLKGTANTWTETAKEQFKKWDLHIGGFFIDMSNFRDIIYHYGDSNYKESMTAELLQLYASTVEEGVGFNIHPYAKTSQSGVPSIYVPCAYDRNVDTDYAANYIANNIQKTPQGVGFGMYRMCFITPTDCLEIKQKLDTQYADKNIEIVDPYTFFKLIRQVNNLS